MSCFRECGKISTVWCGLCSRSYCSNACAIINAGNHQKTCEIDEELFRRDNEKKLKKICSLESCSKLNAKKKCSRCRFAYYCDTVCQELHYSEHRKVCEEATEEKVCIDLKLFFSRYPRHLRMAENLCSKNKNSVILFVFHEGDQRNTQIFHSSPLAITTQFPILSTELTSFVKANEKGHTVIAVLFQDDTYVHGIAQI